MSEVKANKFSSVSTNGNLTLEPDGTGLIVPKRNVVFRVQATDTDLSASGGSVTKITWETVSLDTGGYWDTTNHRYTPSVAGFYLFGGTLRMNASSIVQLVNIIYYKNGAEHIRKQLQFDADRINNGSYAAATSMIELNGSGDYVEMFLEVDETVTVHDNASLPSEFWGMLVHGT
jgi:hypothetical protein|tara:strand:- start:40 stop:564 length:525 start_codon:yes stop_codon:yes gene_type:complete